MKFRSLFCIRVLELEALVFSSSGFLDFDPDETRLRFEVRVGVGTLFGSDLALAKKI